MRQCGAGQVVVDERSAGADLRKARPRGNIFGAVWQQDRDRVAALYPLCIGPCGEAIGEGVELAVSVALALEDEGGVIFEAIDGRLEVVTDERVGIGFDLADRPQCARQPPQKPEFARDWRVYAHLSAPPRTMKRFA